MLNYQLCIQCLFHSHEDNLQKVAKYNEFVFKIIKYMNTQNDLDSLSGNNYMTIGLYANFINVLTQIVHVHSFTISNIKTETI